MNIAFFGLPLAAVLLAADGHAPSVAVLSPVPHPGRRRLARALGRDQIVDALTSDQDLEARVERLLATSRPDLIISWFWTRRIPDRWLSRPPLGAIGVHPSLLPRHRGPNPFFAAIDAGDAVTGVTVHRLSSEYDRGEVLAQTTVPVGERDSWQLARALDRPSLSLLRETVRRLASGEAIPSTPQDESRATWAPEPAGELARVDWKWSTERVLRRIRALAPVPGLALEVRGLRFFVTRATPTTRCPSALVPGEAAVIHEPESRLVIRTGDLAIAIVGAQLVSDHEPAPVGARELANLVSSRSQVIDCRPGGTETCE